MSETSHKNFMKRTSTIMGKVTYTKLYFQEELKMKKMTKTTGIAALIGAVVVGLATIAGKAAANKDRIDEEVDNTFDSLDTTEPEDDINDDVIEPTEGDTPAEEEE